MEHEDTEKFNDNDNVNDNLKLETWNMKRAEGANIQWGCSRRVDAMEKFGERENFVDGSLL